MDAAWTMRVRRSTQEIAPALIGRDCRDQALIDRMLVELDASEQRSRLGGNTLIATSMAVLTTAAATQREPLWRYLAQTNDLAMPLPEIQIIGGGAHAHGRIDLQDIMALPVGAPDWRTALDWCARVYRSAGAIMADAGQLRGVADEGGFWPDVDGNEAVLELMVRAIEHAGLRPLDDVAISLDIAANQFYRGGRYWLRADALDFSPDEWVEHLARWRDRYAVRLIEDPCAEDDRAHYAAFRAAVTPRAAIVGDDLVVTHAQRIREAAADRDDRRRADQTEPGRHHHRGARSVGSLQCASAFYRSFRRAPAKPRMRRSCIWRSAGRRR